MTNEMTAQRSRFHWTQLLSRVIVPAWVITGAMFKLVEADPVLLPSQIREHAHEAGFNLYFVLAVIIAIEFLFVGVMLFIKPLARTAAITILLIFCGVLVNELLNGSKHCGCMGKWSPSPVVMLCIDGGLLLLTAVIRPRYANRTLKSSAVIGAALVIFAGTVASFARIAPMLLAEPIEQTPMTAAETSPAQSEPNTGAITSQPEQGSNTSINPSPKPLPSYVLIQDDEDTLKAWVGKNFRELELFQYMPVWPKGLDKGRHYVIFFSRTCEHCEAMFNRDLIHPQDAPVHAVEIPDDLNVLTSAGAWKMPDNPCEILALPLGTRWIITPPLALTIEDGVVICATPHDYRKCLGLPPLPENEP